MRDTTEKIRGYRMDMTNTTFICQGQNFFYYLICFPYFFYYTRNYTTFPSGQNFCITQFNLFCEDNIYSIYLTFQSSFFNRIVHLWNIVCGTAQPSDLRSLTMFRSFLSRTYLQLLLSCYDVNMTCTWSLHRTCSCHRV